MICDRDRHGDRMTNEEAAYGYGHRNVRPERQNGVLTSGVRIPARSLHLLNQFKGTTVLKHHSTERLTKDELSKMNASFTMSRPVYPSLAASFEVATLPDGRIFNVSSDGSFVCGTPYENMTR